MGTSELAVVGLVGSGVGAMLGTPLVWPRHSRRADLRVLGAGVLAGAGLAGVISARLAGLLPATEVVSHLVNSVGLVAFSLFTGYVRLATGAARPLTGWLMAPLVAYATFAVARGVATGGSEVPFLWLVPVVVGFTLAGANALWRGQTADDLLVPPVWVVGFLAVVNGAQVVRMGFGHVPTVRAIVPLVVAGGFMTLVAFVAWRAVANVMAPVQPGKPRYERSTLDARAALDLLARVDDAMASNRLFARTDLTLARLAEAAGATSHHVSEALNRFRAQTFHDYVNRRRLEDAKAQLADTASDRYTIEGIGATAGFGSRSALYAAFQRFEGMTPTAFRASIRAARRRDV